MIAALYLAIAAIQRQEATTTDPTEYRGLVVKERALWHEVREHMTPWGEI